MLKSNYKANLISGLTALLLAFTCVYPSVSRAVNWQVAGTNIGVLVEFDATSIAKDPNGKISVVTRWELTKHIAEMPTLKGFVQLNEILCETKQIRTLELRAYEVWPPVGSPASLENIPSPWAQATKNTFYDGVVTNVCRESGQ